jgi:hypothetical protein
MKRGSIAIGAVVVGLILTLAACGPKSSSPGGLGNPGGGGLGGGTLTVTVNITGDATVSGTATQDAQGAKIINSCADSVAGDNGEYQIPDLQTANSVGGTSVSIEALVVDYTGPGTYGRDKLEGQGTNAGILIGGTSGSNYALHDRDPATSQVVIDGNGGGTWTFTGLIKDPEKSGNPTISGSVSWTCKDA